MPPALAVFLDRFPELSETFVTSELEALRRAGCRVRVEAETRGNAAAAPGDDGPPVFYRSDDGHIREMRWSAGAGWVSADLTTQTSAANASANSNLTGYFFPSQQTRHVFYRSDDGHVRELWWGK